MKSVTDLLKYVMQDSGLRRLLENIQLWHMERLNSVIAASFPFPLFSKDFKAKPFAFVSGEDLDRIKPEIIGMLQ